MKVQVLHIDACPNWRETGARTRQALDVLGLVDVPVEYVLIRTVADAAKAAFAGSPTILVDGVDLFPSRDRTLELACRVYLTEEGPAGMPTRAGLDAAVRARVVASPSVTDTSRSALASGPRGPRRRGPR